MKPAVLTYTLCMPIELTRLCSNACDFCPYPFTAHEPLLPLSKVKRAIGRARRLGACLIDFVSGEAPQAYPELLHTLSYYHCRSFLEYLALAAAPAHRPPDGAPAIPVRLDVGTLKSHEWRLMRKHFPSVRLLLTSLDAGVMLDGALRNSPTQHYEDRLQSIVEAGDAGMPLTSGTMIGIGETSASREKAIKVIAAIARKFGHIQAFQIQAFRPHPATPMGTHPPASLSELLETVGMARRFLPPSVRVQVNALDWREHLGRIVGAGATDLGDLNIQLLTRGKQILDMELALLFEPLEKAGYPLRCRRPRLLLAGAPARTSKTAA